MTRLYGMPGNSTSKCAIASLLLVGHWLAAVTGSASVSADEVSFHRDVMAVLSKAGCNQGTCHGSASGKNGFKLSLRGDDPQSDFLALARQQFGRRTNRVEPECSLILQKATARVPHEGGRRFDVDSEEYRLLVDWIGAGTPQDSPEAASLIRLEIAPREQVLFEPDDRLQLCVEATFGDGTTRDVTEMAVYEPSIPAITVSPAGEVRREQFGEASVMVRYLSARTCVEVAYMPDRPEITLADWPIRNLVDEHVAAKLRRLRIQPSDDASESTFLRRAYLDALGVLPTVEETREFLADSRPDRRSRLIDRLLDRPEFDEYWALKWADLLRAEEKVLDRKGVQALSHWLRQGFAERKPLDRLAYELVASRGSTYTEPAANYHRALRDPLTAAEATAQVFLGVRLQCARCHNHPFERWTQADYYGFAACFARVRYKIVENQRRDRFDKHEFDGEQIVWIDREGEVKNPATGKAAAPQFLGDDDAQPGDDENRLLSLAGWISNPANDMFARMQANRIWFHLLGRGIVDPVDDFQLANPPSNTPLLDALAEELVDHEFDLRHLVRLIMNSTTYQTSAVPTDTNRDDERNFGRAYVRPLDAEPLLDAIAQVIEAEPRFNGYPPSMRAGQLPGVQAFRPRDKTPTEGEAFLKIFGKPLRSLTCECERTRDPTLGQAFQLVSGPLIEELLSHPENRIGRLVAASRDDNRIVEEFYLAALCRLPSEDERQVTTAYIGAADDRRAAIEDVVAALLTSKEFLLRR